MMILNEILENNKKFVDEFEGEELSHHPQKKLAILTCMDCRLTGFLEPALGIGRGDAKIIKNAGNTIVGEDAIRSIAAAIFSLGAEEVLVIGHTECGMAGSDPDKLRNAMIERGIPQEEIDKVDLKKKKCLQLNSSLCSSRIQRKYNFTCRYKYLLCYNILEPNCCKSSRTWCSVNEAII